MALFEREQLYNASNRRLTKMLFYEYTTDKSQAILNLSDVDKYGTLSLRRLFIPLVVEDPTEHLFAETVFGDYGFWVFLQEQTQSWTKDLLNQWRREADVERKSMAFKAILGEVRSGKSAYQAAKYIIEEPWKVKTAPDKRKARKEARETAQEAFENAGVAEDIARLKAEGFIQ